MVLSQPSECCNYKHSSVFWALDYDSDNMINKVYWCGNLNIIGPLTPKGGALLGSAALLEEVCHAEAGFEVSPAQALLSETLRRPPVASKT